MLRRVKAIDPGWKIRRKEAAHPNGHNADDYANDEALGLIAKQLIPKEELEGQNISLNQTGIQFNVFGQEHIEEGAMHQM